MLRIKQAYYWHIFDDRLIEQRILDTNAGKRFSKAASDVWLTLVLKKWTAFKYRLELWPPDVSKGKSKCWYPNNCLHF